MLGMHPTIQNSKTADKATTIQLGNIHDRMYSIALRETTRCANIIMTILFITLHIIIEINAQYNGNSLFKKIYAIGNEGNRQHISMI